MRRPCLVALLSVLPAVASSTGCAGVDKSYRDFAPQVPSTLSASPASPEADALVARFYGPGTVDRAALDGAIRRAPTHSGLREIAGYDAITRADKHAAFEHFLAAAADPNAISPELYLWEMKSLARSTTDHMRAQALLRAVKDGHPRPAIRQLASYDLARELSRVGEHEEAAALVSTLGFIDAWQVVGAFDNDQGKGFDTEYPPERAPDLARTYAGVRLPVKFRPIAVSKLDGALQLGDVLAPSNSAVAYAQTFVTSTALRQVDLRLTTTSGVRVWVDDKLVASDDKIFHDELDNVVVRIPLSPGENRVLVKVAHESGPFRLAARITNTDGSIATDLRYASAGTSVPAPPAEASMVSPMGAIDRLTDKNRQRFLQARVWTREGHARRAAYFLTPLLTEARDNPTVMLFAAQALLENAESGKALDLWSRGAQRFPDMLGFLTERARFYEGRHLLEKAERDLAAVITKNPTARDAGMELASVHGGRALTIDRCLDLEAVVTKWADDATAVAELGRCKLDRGYAEEAERLLKRAHALAPGDVRILFNLADLAERRLDYGTAHERLHEVQAARPGSLEVLLTEANLYRAEGKLAEARASLEAAKALSPDSARAYDRLAELAYERREIPDAERWWRLALEREPEDATVVQRLAALAPTALPLGDRLAPKAEDIDRAVRSASSVKVHAGSHTVLLLDDQVATVNADGSSKRIVTEVTLATNTTGRDQLIQAHLPAGRVNVIEAYAINKGGERQEASSVQGGVIRFRGLEIGSITVIQYAHFAPAPRFLPNEFVGTWHFQGLNQQVEQSRWRLVMAKERELHSDTHGKIEAGVEAVGEQKVWSFSAHGVPPFIPEPNMSPAIDELWTASVSTLKSWDGFARWESALLHDAFTSGSELDALAHKLTAGATTPREKLDRLSWHVAQEIRYQQEYEDSIAGVKPHSAGIVVERGYGDCKDKAVLMIRLARAVGLELRFALLRTTNVGKVKTDIPNQQFNHAIVYAPKQPGIDEALFVDTTTNGLDIGNLRTDDQGATSLVLDKDSRWEMIPIPYQDASLELVRHDIKVALGDPTKVALHDHVETRGAIASSARGAVRTGEGAKRYFQGVSDQLFPGTTLVTGKAEHPDDVTHPLAMDLEVDAANAVKTEDDRLRLEVPVVFPLSHVAALTTRHHPLRLWRGVQELAMDADLGDKAKIAHLPADFTVDHPCFSVSRKTDVKASHVIVRTRYRNTCAEIAPADYPAFRASVQAALAKTQDAIVWSAPARPKIVAPKK